MNKLIVFLFIIFFSVLHTPAQLILIQGNSVSSDYELYDRCNLIAFVNSTSALATGNCRSVSSEYTVSTLDSSWDDSFFYFILYRKSDRCTGDRIESFGTILFEAPSFFIFKTTHGILTEFDAFLPFELCLIGDEPVSKPPAENKPRYPSNFQQNEIVNKIVNSVSIDTLWNRIRTLQKMDRYTNSTTTINYFKQYFSLFNFDSVYTHSWTSGGLPNIIAEKRGTTLKTEFCYIGGHYDVSKSGYPGADDNGSGTAGAMEIARVIAGDKFKRSIRIVLFSGEEQGLLGSKAYASMISQNNVTVTAMLNLDMIAYLKKNDPLQLDVCSNTQSRDLFTTFGTIKKLYLPDSVGICDAQNSQWANGSDHASFWGKGYKALYFGDDLDPNGPPHPCYHTTADTLGYGANSKVYAENMLKSIVACFTTLSEPDPNTVIQAKSSYPDSRDFLFTFCKSNKIIITAGHNNNEWFSIEVITPLGKIMKTETARKMAVIHTQTFAPGVYFLLLTQGNSNTKVTVVIKS